MKADTLQLLVLLGTLLGFFCAAVGIAVRLVLVPYLRTHLVQPVQNVEQAVTQNTNTSNPPTLLDMVHDIQRDVSSLKQDVAENSGETRETKAEVLMLSTMFDGHLEWSQATVDRMAAEIKAAQVASGLVNDEQHSDSGSRTRRHARD